MDILQIAIQGGGIGIAGLSLYYIFKISSNHINHSNQAINKNTEMLTKLECAIQNNTEVIRDLICVIRKMK